VHIVIVQIPDTVSFVD